MIDRPARRPAGSRRLLAGRLAASAEGERGSVTVFLVAAVLVLVFVTLAFMIPLGAAVVDRRTASTAADAAALAAAGLWRDSLKETYSHALDASDDEAFWSLLGRSVGSYRPVGMSETAATFAARNDSVLVDFTVDARAGTVAVKVRSLEAVPETGQHVYSTATAALDFDRGLCLSGGVIGIRIDGRCVVSAPPAPEPEPTVEAGPEDPGAGEDPAPAPEPPEEPPYEIPDGVDASFAMSTRLVGS
ncbi:pilus assembly protein TadG-related protein [Sanguibacter suarezii]|uniref:pilus assembly protein TadG-related protein n=1 Tax=Sanguibacter suarezii TaxID=60921 RepID=UPI0012FC4EFC|nr:pilus assembly protein TadG-related protein [Sanguibacter suarezii]